MINLGLIMIYTELKIHNYKIKMKLIRKKKRRRLLLNDLNKIKLPEKGRLKCKWRQKTQPFYQN